MKKIFKDKATEDIFNDKASKAAKGFGIFDWQLDIYPPQVDWMSWDFTLSTFLNIPAEYGISASL